MLNKEITGVCIIVVWLYYNLSLLCNHMYVYLPAALQLQARLMNMDASQPDLAINLSSDREKTSRAHADEFQTNYSSSSNVDHVASELPPAENFIYSTKSITPELQQQLQQSMHQCVKYFGRQAFGSIKTLDILGDNGLARYACKHN